MKVRELIIELLKHPMSAEVVITEGCKHSLRTTCENVQIGCFFPEEREYHQVNNCPSPEEGCVRAVCLGPVRK